MDCGQGRTKNKHARHQQASSSHNCNQRNDPSNQRTNQPTNRPSKRQRISRVCSGQMTAANQRRTCTCLLLTSTSARKRWRINLTPKKKRKKQPCDKVVKTLFFSPLLTAQIILVQSLLSLDWSPGAVRTEAHLKLLEHTVRRAKTAKKQHNPSSDEAPLVDFFGEKKSQ